MEGSQTVAARLRELRHARQWSQEEAAHRIGISARTLVGWETGSRYPREASLRKAARCYGVDVADLLPPDRLDALEERVAALERAVYGDDGDGNGSASGC